MGSCLGEFASVVNYRPSRPIVDLLGHSSIQINANAMCQYRYVRDRVLERFEPKKIKRNDMLGTFLEHGVTKEEMENEAIILL